MFIAKTPTASTTSNPSAASQRAQLSDFKSEVEAKMGELNSSKEVKTVNVLDLFNDGSAPPSPGPDGKVGPEVGFNEFKIGTPEWLEEGMKTGVFISGISLEDILAADSNLSDDDLTNIIRGVKELAGFLQEFQDKIVRLVNEGATEQQIQDFASSAMSTGNMSAKRDIIKGSAEGETAKYLPGLFYQLFLTTPVSEMNEMFNDFPKGDGIGRKNSAAVGISGMTWESRFAEATKVANIEPSDRNKRRDQVHNDAMRVAYDFKDEIDDLPPELRAEAQEIVNESMNAAIDTADAGNDDSLPEVPEYQHDSLVFKDSKSRESRDEYARRMSYYETNYA